MVFQSILFCKDEYRVEENKDASPHFLDDLNLDQIIDVVTKSKEDYHLKPIFNTPLSDIETIYYRQAVMQDMQEAPLMEEIKNFASQMIIVRRYLGLMERLDYHYHIRGWFLEAVLVYCEAINTLEHGLGKMELRSTGLIEFYKYLSNFVHGHAFKMLLSHALSVKKALSNVKYSIVIKDGKFTVRNYEDETDYSSEIQNFFNKFKQTESKDYRMKLDRQSGMNHIEAIILDFVTRLYPETFASLDQFFIQHKNFVDETIRVFDREIQFYISYLEFINPLRKKGLDFCYPQVNAASPQIHAKETFDLALASILLRSDKKVICNDFFLEEPERIIIVSGPNQGGKTTFARMFGQLHYLASLGCPVPGKCASLSLFDRIFTHFEKEEDIRNLRGKLQDDLLRIHNILDQATPHSILILNEIFSSTTLQDAVFLSKEILAKVISLEILCIWVTFIDELSTLSEKTISMVSTVMPENPVLRTFKIIRQPADGLAYALSIAKKHRLTYTQIKERLYS